MIKLSSDLQTLEQFLLLPEFEPPLQFIRGRVIQKMSPKLPHSFIQTELSARLNGFARPRGLGRAMTELRCTFGGQSIVPDIAYFRADRLPTFTRGQEAPDVRTTPDLAIEIRSPGQTLQELKVKLRVALKYGASLGWLIDTAPERVFVLRPGLKAEELRAGEILRGEDVLPGFDLPIDELFGWLD